MLTISHLSKTYPKSNLEVLSDISISVKKGEFVSIVGPSGCGKSTLFNIVAGIEQETSGEISEGGRTSRGPTSYKNRKGKFGYMLQKPLLLPFRTVLQNVMLGLEIKNVEKSKAKEKAQQLLKKFGLLEFANFYPHTLSGGMAQKVALLRTILFNNEFLLLDEPFGALDAITRRSLQLWLLSVWKEFDSSILFITHDINEAIFLSDRVYILSSRPATVVKELNITLPRPRKLEYLSDPIFTKHVQDIEGLLLKEQAIS